MGKIKIYILVFPLLLVNFLPLVSYNLPPVIRSNHFWALFWGAALLLSHTRDVVLNKPFSSLFVYGLLLLFGLNTFWLDVHEDFTNRLILEFYNISLALSVYTYFRVTQKFDILANFTKITLVFIFITAVMSIIISIINPMYARDIIGVDVVGNADVKANILRYRKYGGGNYSYATAIVGLIPMLVYTAKKRTVRLERNLIILFIIIIFIALIRMQIFANILAASVISFLSLTGHKNNSRSYIFLLSLVILAILIPREIYSLLLRQVATLFEVNSENFNKFNDISNFLMNDGLNDGTGIGDRASRYPLLIQSFLSDPLIGGEYGNIHLYWANKLASFGMVGLFSFIYILHKNIKANLKYFQDNEFVFYYLLAVLGILGLGFMKAIQGRETWLVLFIIIPGIYYLNNNHKR